MKPNIAIIAIIISVISLVFSIVVLCVICPRSINIYNGNLGFDYLGVIIGMLSFIVTVLISFQVYNAYNIQKQLEDLENKQTDIEKSHREQIKKLIAAHNTLKQKLGELMAVSNSFSAKTFDALSQLKSKMGNIEHSYCDETQG